MWSTGEYSVHSYDPSDGPVTDGKVALHYNRLRPALDIPNFSTLYCQVEQLPIAES
jgi:hypothetical protein